MNKRNVIIGCIGLLVLIGIVIGAVLVSRKPVPAEIQSPSEKIEEQKNPLLKNEVKDNIILKDEKTEITAEPVPEPTEEELLEQIEPTAKQKSDAALKEAREKEQEAAEETETQLPVAETPTEEPQQPTVEEPLAPVVEPDDEHLDYNEEMNIEVPLDEPVEYVDPNYSENGMSIDGYIDFSGWDVNKDPFEGYTPTPGMEDWDI